MINSIINANHVPKVFKLSRILPLSKPEKDTNYIESFRPNNNLPCLEKILEEHILSHLHIFLEKIILLT